MKNIFLLFALLISFRSSAQNFAWAGHISGSNRVISNALVTDATGNLYTIGYFQGTADFDPSMATFNLVSNGDYDIYIQKLDPTGNLLWAKSIGGSGADEGIGMAIDATGNVYLIGTFENTVDFDPGAGTYNLTASSFYHDGFLLKLDVNGDFVWAHNWGANRNVTMRGIAIDALQNIDICGSFDGTTDFDPSASTVSRSSSGSSDAFMLRMNTSGNFQWVRTFGSVEADVATAIDHDQSGNIYMCGMFAGTVDLDPSAVNLTRSSVGYNDNFVQKFNANGELQWVRTMGASVSYDYIRDIEVGPHGGVFTCGGLSGSGDFDPSAGVLTLSAAGNYDMFLHKLDTNGNFAWAFSAGASFNDEALGLVTDANGDLFATGYFSGTTDFDPSAGTTNLTAGGNFDPFVLKLTTAGGLVWVRQLVTNLYGSGRTIALDAAGAIFVAGTFEGTMDADPGPGTVSFSTGSRQNTYQLKLGMGLLPVEYADFFAEQEGRSVRLEWHTELETDPAFFEVERAGHPDDFVAIGRVAADGPSAYTFVDAAPLAGVSWYRLRQVDQDGSSHFSKVEAVTFHEAAAFSAVVYPNPVQGGDLRLQLRANSTGNLLLEIADATGRTIVRQESRQEAGTSVVRLPVHELPSGMYFLRAIHDGEVRLERFLIP